MTQKLKAIFDGKVFRPEGPVSFPAHTSVELTVQTAEKAKKGKPYSLLHLASAAKLQGPKDFSTNLDDYLYRGKPLE
jgi:hypothetical protein